ncbi:conserved hypothetical protein [Rhodopseudomonas palustris BisB18]|uniref:DUF2147 domain-containing protein n=2 Tax=Rhodopseudomonas palustris TaxID=1076 RepID=Q219A9_RHOPB
MWTFGFGARRLAAVVAAVAVLVGSAMAAGAAEPTAAGLWQRSEDGKPVVWLLMLDRGNGMYEGVVAKTFPKPGVDPNAVCDECEDDRKNAPVLGISLIRDMKRKGLEYLGGNILDPRNGDIWKAQLKVSPDGQALTLRGYLMTPMLGKDETWQRLPDTALAQLDPAIVAKFLPAQAAQATPAATTAAAGAAGAAGAAKPSVAPKAKTTPAPAAK